MSGVRLRRTARLDVCLLGTLLGCARRDSRNTDSPCGDDGSGSTVSGVDSRIISELSPQISSVADSVTAPPHSRSHQRRLVHTSHNHPSRNPLSRNPLSRTSRNNGYRAENPTGTKCRGAGTLADQSSCRNHRKDHTHRADHRPIRPSTCGRNPSYSRRYPATDRGCRGYSCRTPRNRHHRWPKRRRSVRKGLASRTRFRRNSTCQGRHSPWSPPLSAAPSNPNPVRQTALSW